MPATSGRRIEGVLSTKFGTVHIMPLNYALEISEINGICDVIEKYIREQDVYEYNREK